MNDPISVANRWIAAYNAMDLDVVRELTAPDIKKTHHNRGVYQFGPDEIIKAMEEFAPIAPDKAYGETFMQFTDGERVVTLLKWGFTATVDLPSFDAKAGDKVERDFACIWTFKDGKIVECHDFG